MHCSVKKGVEFAELISGSKDSSSSFRKISCNVVYMPNREKNQLDLGMYVRPPPQAR